MHDAVINRFRTWRDPDSPNSASLFTNAIFVFDIVFLSDNRK